ncbi:MAG: UbiA family prenyltransferase [Candidatus Lokiarchaeota archaeon]
MLKRKGKAIINLLRIRQYYKNFLIFIALFFSQKLFVVSYYFPLILGFILLCISSSINYIINDIGDIEKDKEHPEKFEKKPLASGDLSITTAIVILIILIVLTIFLLLFLLPNLGFLVILILIIITGQLYNHLFKRYAFVDILSLSVGYIWRTLAGCVLINTFISAWLFLAIFEVALFLVIAKRKGDLNLLKTKENAIKHKKIYNQYSQKLLDQFHILIAGSIFMTYSLYLIIKFNLFATIAPELKDYISILTIPLALYIIMRFMYLTSAKPKLARRAEKAFLDKGIIVSGLILGVILFYSFYYEVIIQYILIFF